MRMALSRTSALAATLGVWLWPAAARAELHTQVEVLACQTQPAAEQFRTALGIELSALDAAIALDAATLHSELRRLRITRCAIDEGVLEVSLTTPDQPQDERRTLDLRDVPEPARPRVAAIAVAEMVRAWPPAVTPVVQAVLPTPLPRVGVRERSHPELAAQRQSEFALAARAVAVGTGPTLLYGADASFSRPLGSWLRVGVATSYQRANFDGVIGTAILNAFGGEFSLAVPLNESASAELCPFISGTYLRASAQSAIGLPEATDTAWIASAGLSAQLHSALGSRFGLLTSFGIGHTLRGALFRAGNELGFGVQGALLQARVGFTFAL
jgi:hypothetical protein